MTALTFHRRKQKSAKALCDICAKEAGPGRSGLWRCEIMGWPVGSVCSKHRALFVGWWAEATGGDVRA